MGSADRRVLRPRRDADGLRGAPPPPADHAAGVQARATGRIRGPDEPGDRPRHRRLAARQRVPALQRRQAVDARRRHRGVRRRAAERRGRSPQRRFHQHRPRRPGDHPRGRAGRQVAPRPREPSPARALLPQPIAGQARERDRRPVQRAVPGAGRGRGTLQRRGRRQSHDLHDDGGTRHEHDHASR